MRIYLQNIVLFKTFLAFVSTNFPVVAGNVLTAGKLSTTD